MIKKLVINREIIESICYYKRARAISEAIGDKSEEG